MKKKNIQFLQIILFFLCFFLFFKVHADNDEKLNNIFKNVRCVICQGQSINESNSDFAENLKMVITNKVESGYSEEEIYVFLKEKYGDWILFKPSVNLKNILLWTIPYLIFVLGGIFLILLVKKNKN